MKPLLQIKGIYINIALQKILTLLGVLNKIITRILLN